MEAKIIKSSREVYIIVNSGELTGVPVELSEEQILEYEQLEKVYTQMQKKLEEVYNDS